MIVYVRHNTSRKLEFMVRTEIVRGTSGLVVHKKAGAVEAAPFVESLEKKYAQFAQVADQLPFELARVERSAEGVTVEHVTGTPLLSLLADAARERDAERFAALIEQYVGLILGMPTKAAQSSPVLSQLGLDAMPGAHIYPGCLDLNAGNFAQESQGRFVLFDYEWTLEVPTPRLFVLFWGLIALYEDLAYLHPNGLVPLASLYRRFDMLPHMERLVRATFTMYGRVQALAQRESYQQYSQRVAALQIDRPFMGEVDQLKKKLEQAAERQRVLQWEIGHRDEIAQQEKVRHLKLEASAKEHEWITKSKTWKTRNFVVGMLRYIVKR
jgi:hypothetical protein